MSARPRGLAVVLMVTATLVAGLVAGSASAAAGHKRAHAGAAAQPGREPRAVRGDLLVELGDAPLGTKFCEKYQ